jgi:hypothetical protein
MAEELSNSRPRITEAIAGVTALVFLLLGEWLLFGLDRLSEDAADIVGICAFGGLLIAVLRDGLGRKGVGPEAASLVLGTIVALAILHGSRPPGTELGPATQRVHFFVDIGPVLDLHGKPWDVNTGLAVGAIAGGAMALAAEVVQRISDVRQTVSFGRLAISLATGVATGIAVATSLTSLFSQFNGPASGTLQGLTVLVVVALSILAAASAQLTKSDH